MARFRILDGGLPGFERVTADSIGVSQPGTSRISSPVLSTAWAEKYLKYTPPIAPPNGYKFYRILVSGYPGARLYLSEIHFSRSAVFSESTRVTPVSMVVPTEYGGNMADPSVLYDDDMSYWSGGPAGPSSYTMIGVAFAQDVPIRSIYIRTGGGGGIPSGLRIDRSNDEAAWGAHPYNGKAWLIGDDQTPTWTLFDSYNKYAYASVPPPG